jgi:transcriptional regulator GlxA family with amidase domain
MQYLTKWRMQIASEMLPRPTANMARIASEVGYASEAAFSALSRTSPANLRRRGENAQPERHILWSKEFTIV